MLGKYAFRGYSLGCRDGECRCASFDFAPYHRNNPWTSCELDRICGWVNLLRKLELKATPDVVAIYLVATRQESLLHPFIDNSENRFMSHIGCGCGNEKDGVRKTFGVEKGLPREFSGEFPAELFKMAYDYLLYRTDALMSCIMNTVTETEGSLRYEGLHVGTRLPARIVNALAGFSSVRSSINTVTESIKALHATIMPDVVAGTGTEREFNTYRTLRWDVGSSCTGHETCHYGKGVTCDDSDNLLVTIGASTVRQFRAVADSISYICPHLDRAQGIQEFNFRREAFCDLMEIILYITALARNYRGAIGMHLRQVDDINKLFFKDKVDDNGHVKHNALPDRVSSSTLGELHTYCNITPAGAVVLGDGLTKNLRYYCPQGDAQLRAYLESVVPRPYGEVMTFLLNEWKFQIEELRKVGRYLKEREAKGADAHEADNCACTCCR